ncbi:MULTISPECIES: AlpA family phage regulatory protein [unclassified Bradyrhizobium]|uniref:helix-turn-helix transcriptional regulator n=1 Tax=unclassified Bradyrhizobium TaxID=2631580 RepID=UPI001FFB9205|nr:MULTISPECIES: AlpA family phage regulatory protein [unclassified Bradyrhizobium]
MVGTSATSARPAFFIAASDIPEHVAVSQQLIAYEALAPKGIVYSKVQLWRLERAAKFPKRVKLSAQRVAWIESEIDEWIGERIAARRQPMAA